jgi:hypothetical protein
MSEKSYDLKPGADNSVRIHGSINRDRFEVFVNGDGYIALFFDDKNEDVRWIKEQSQRKQERQ